MGEGSGLSGEVGLSGAVCAGFFAGAETFLGAGSLTSAMAVFGFANALMLASGLDSAGFATSTLAGSALGAAFAISGVLTGSGAFAGS